MKKTNHFAGVPRREGIAGGVWLVVSLLVLPSLLQEGNAALGSLLSSSELNFVYYLTNFMAMLWIFHDFLGHSAAQAVRHPAYLCQAVILGSVAYFACAWVLEQAIGYFVPGFQNANDASIAALKNGNVFLTAVGTVILVPPFEECMYRGLIFRGLYGKSPAAAYIVSILVFALVHVLGFIGRYSLLELCIAILQYLPAGLCLAWAYTKADTIFAPILIHTIINAIGIYRLG